MWQIDCFIWSNYTALMSRVLFSFGISLVSVIMDLYSLWKKTFIFYFFYFSLLSDLLFFSKYCKYSWVGVDPIRFPCTIIARLEDPVTSANPWWQSVCTTLTYSNRIVSKDPIQSIEINCDIVVKVRLSCPDVLLYFRTLSTEENIACLTEHDRTSAITQDLKVLL